MSKFSGNFELFPVSRMEVSSNDKLGLMRNATETLLDCGLNFLFMCVEVEQGIGLHCF